MMYAVRATVALSRTLSRVQVGFPGNVVDDYLVLDQLDLDAGDLVDKQDFLTDTLLRLLTH